MHHTTPTGPPKNAKAKEVQKAVLHVSSASNASCSSFYVVLFTVKPMNDRRPEALVEGFGRGRKRPEGPKPPHRAEGSSAIEQKDIEPYSFCAKRQDSVDR